MLIADLQLTITPTYALYTQNVADGAIAVNESTTQGRYAVILDFNNTEGLYTRDLGTIFSWPLSAGTILDVWQPSIALMDDDVYDRLSYHALMSSLGGVGWQHAREINVAYASTTDLTLLLSFGVGAYPASITLTIPNSGGLETKAKVILPPNKWKLIEIFLSSAQPFKFWGADFQLKIKNWGSAEEYRVARPVQG